MHGEQRALWENTAHSQCISWTSFNIFLLFLHPCLLCFATDLPWRVIVRLKSLMIMKCFWNRKHCFTSNLETSRNCHMYSIELSESLLSPSITRPPANIRRNYGHEFESTSDSAWLICASVTTLFWHLYVHFLEDFKPFVTKGNQNADYKCFPKVVSSWLRMKNWSPGYKSWKGMFILLAWPCVEGQWFRSAHLAHCLML